MDRMDSKSMQPSETLGLLAIYPTGHGAGYERRAVSTVNGEKKRSFRAALWERLETELKELYKGYQSQRSDT